MLFGFDSKGMWSRRGRERRQKVDMSGAWSIFLLLMEIQPPLSRSTGQAPVYHAFCSVTCTTPPQKRPRKNDETKISSYFA